MHEEKIIIATHQMLYGASQALRDYLNLKKQKKVFFIGLPLLENNKYIFEYYDKGSKQSQSEFFSPPIPIIARYILDVFIVFYWGLKGGRKNIFIGVDPLNNTVGLFLRQIGIVDRVIFYSIDFAPKRFENYLLNNIYHFFEKTSVQRSDEVWNVSPRIAEGRQKFLKLSQRKYIQKVVPIGVWKHEITRKKTIKNKSQILFIGHLLEKQGVQEVIKAIPLIQKKIKNIRLTIVGGGVYEEFLKAKVKQLGLNSKVDFLGWVKDRKKLKKIMGECSVAVACYKPERLKIRNFSYYADPTKIKDYLSCGLPIVLTDISFNAKLIMENKCGIIVKYKSSDIARGINKILSNEKTLQQYSKNARNYIKNYTWDKIFKKAFIDYEQRRPL